MADDPLLALQDPDYNSASDEEFDPNAAGEDIAADDDDASSISSSDNEGGPKKSAKPANKSRKRKRSADDDDAELDSGDEATIATARRRQQQQQQRGSNKKQRQDEGGDDDVDLLSDGGGEGGLVKTRAQRRTEQKERRPLARVDGATADVDAIWAALSTAPVGKKDAGGAGGDEEVGEDGIADGKKEGLGTQDAVPAEETEEEMITIKRTYDFAGDRITEERQVPKSSAEAKLYLAHQQGKPDKQQSSATPDVDSKDKDAAGGEEAQEAARPGVRRPLHRPSRFDPNPTAEVKGLSPEKQLTWARRRILLDPNAATPLSTSTALNTTADAQAANAAAIAAKKGRDKAQKLNTVDKSRLDWAGYVDKEGIADELDEYGRAKEGYLGRMDFLNRVDERREEERRAAKAALKT
ncbi:swr1p complex component [Diplodia corticola]|uniref:SWR1-complex protein 5 n=1 Tax=Diplodia corticola TaxID=236234 RepID=A0A1J9S3I2_9PEZI|nr:swr1p complex component [Diplodia corticola]OJD34556.1 swr1p complex component [Diplodia corticola]